MFIKSGFLVNTVLCRCDSGFFPQPITFQLPYEIYVIFEAVGIDFEIIFYLLQGIERIVFAGNFLRTNPVAQKTLAYAMEYWTKGTKKALFLQHEVKKIQCCRFILNFFYNCVCCS